MGAPRPPREQGQSNRGPPSPARGTQRWQKGAWGAQGVQWGPRRGGGRSHPSPPCPQALEAERLRNFQQLLQLEEEVLVPNREVLECRICYQQVAPGEGVLLRECLHNFCR